MPTRSSIHDLIGRLLHVDISLRMTVLDTSSASMLVGSVEVASKQLTRCPSKDIVAA
jgi:hypothetical protein